MAEVIVWLINQGLKVIITSSPEKYEMEKAKRIMSLVPLHTMHYASHLIDLCGKTTIKQLAAISEASDLFLGIDSAPMHIAAAVGTPVIAIFGGGVNSWRPWCKKNVVLFKEAVNRKGIKRKEYIRKNLIQITPNDVIIEVQNSLSKKSTVSSTKKSD
jgi:ADP-heptose:LPS heptosyltransferase